jgi:hypothetical protein
MTPLSEEYPSGTGGSRLMSEADEMPINTLKSRPPSVSKDGNDCHPLEKNRISELPMDFWYHVTAINMTMDTAHVQKEGLSLIRPVALFPGSNCREGWKIFRPSPYPHIRATFE